MIVKTKFDKAEVLREKVSNAGYRKLCFAITFLNEEMITRAEQGKSDFTIELQKLCKMYDITIEDTTNIFNKLLDAGYTVIDKTEYWVICW